MQTKSIAAINSTFKMDIKLLLVFTTMAIINCLQLIPVSGLPTVEEEHDVMEADSNKTDWTIFPPNPHRQKRATFRCRSYRQGQLIRKLNKLGSKSGVSYGGFNRQYMAFTWRDAIKFPSMVATVSSTPRNVSSIRALPLRSPTKASTIMTSSNCKTSDGGLLRLCSACPAVTFLGHNKIPSYINEVICGQTQCSFGVGGICQNAVMYQTFLHKTGQCNPITGYEELLPYTQPIRVCCECMM